jgi:hypothetical protein
MVTWVITIQARRISESAHLLERYGIYLNWMSVEVAARRKSAVIARGGSDAPTFPGRALRAVVLSLARC